MICNTILDAMGNTPIIRLHRMVDENCKPLVFSEAFYLATKGGGEFFGNVGSFEKGYEFDAVVLDDSILYHPQKLNLAERMERAFLWGLTKSA